MNPALNSTGRWRSILSVLLLAMIISGIGCKGNTGPTGPAGAPGGNDKEIRLSFSATQGTAWSDTNWHSDAAQVAIYRFNKNNYVGVDSIIFVALLETADSTAPCTMRLFNLTDSAMIQGSLISSSSRSLFLVQSSNISSSLPGKEITIVPQVKSGKSGVQVQGYDRELWLLRE